MFTFQERDCLVDEINRLHRLGGQPRRADICIEPLAGWIEERPPRTSMIASVRRMRLQIPLPIGGVQPNREAMGGRVVKVHLADRERNVIEIAQPMTQGQRGAGKRSGELSHTDRVRKQPRDQRLPARRTKRRVAIRSLKENALASQCIEVGSRLPGITLDPECAAAMVVGDDDKQVGLLAHSRLRRLRPRGLKGRTKKHEWNDRENTMIIQKPQRDRSPSVIERSSAHRISRPDGLLRHLPGGTSWFLTRDRGNMARSQRIYNLYRVRKDASESRVFGRIAGMAWFAETKSLPGVTGIGPRDLRGWSCSRRPGPRHRPRRVPGRLPSRPWQ